MGVTLSHGGRGRRRHREQVAAKMAKGKRKLKAILRLLLHKTDGKSLEVFSKNLLLSFSSVSSFLVIKLQVLCLLRKWSHLPLSYTLVLLSIYL